LWLLADTRSLDAAPKFGMSGGHVTTGSTVANLTALWAARDVLGVRRVVVSDRGHNSVEKACNLLGLGLVRAKACATTHSLRRGALEEALGDDEMERKRTAVVSTAGTVATGAVDELLSSEQLGVAWVHCDAAWAGPLKFASSSTKSKNISEVLSGLEAAESCSFSAHKWLYQPKGCAFILFGSGVHDKAREAMSFGGGYLAAATVGVNGSQAASCIPLAATLLSWGEDGLSSRLEGDVRKAEELADLVERDERFELFPRSKTGIVCWRPKGGVDVKGLRDAVAGEVWISTTIIDGEIWLRSVAANPNADPAKLFTAISSALEERSSTSS